MKEYKIKQPVFRITDDTKYIQPDAANFNSWRRHICLVGDPPDEVVHAWEDVKVNFVLQGVPINMSDNFYLVFVQRGIFT